MIEKKIRNWRFWNTDFLFENVLLQLISKYSLQTPSLDNILLGNFKFSNSVIFVKDLIRWMRGFEMFLTDHYTGDSANKKIAGKY